MIVETAGLRPDQRILNMGPQHPSMHGVLRLVVTLEGESVTDVRPDIGYLHRSTEWIGERRTYAQFVPYTDRLDYVSGTSNNLAYVLAVEKLAGIEVPPRATYIRMLLAELNRIASHLIWLGTFALDLGAWSVFLYCFREREYILDILEECTGARLTYSWFRIGGVPDDLPPAFVRRTRKFLRLMPGRLDENDTLLTGNRIFRARTEGVGILDPQAAISYGASGPVLRGSGVEFDVRRAEPYAAYDKLDFRVPTHPSGDCLGRYLVRIEEMRQSNRIVRQCVEWLRAHPGPVITANHKVAPPSRVEMKSNMEELIHHFKLFTEGIHVPPGETYAAVEHPKGEFGVYFVSDGANKPYRMKLRVAGFPHLAAMDELARGHMIADAVAIIGTLDIVFGEIDR